MGYVHKLSIFRLNYSWKRSYKAPDRWNPANRRIRFHRCQADILHPLYSLPPRSRVGSGALATYRCQIELEDSS